MAFSVSKTGAHSNPQPMPMFSVRVHTKLLTSNTEKRIFPLTSASRPALGPTQPPVQWVPGALCPGVKRGRGVMLATHPLAVPRLKKCRSCTSPHPNAPLWSVTGPLSFHYRKTACVPIFVGQRTDFALYEIRTRFLFRTLRLVSLPTASS
jgi:hypothetical protein